MGLFDGISNLIYGSPGQNGNPNDPNMTAAQQAEYNSDITPTLNSLEQDTSIDSISRQELITQLQQGNTNFEHTGDTADAVVQSVDAQLAIDSSNDPLYVGRRYNEDTYNQRIAQPGRMQTQLTANDQTPQGTPTLLTSAVGANQGTAITSGAGAGT